jgi:hypothetical protein
MKYLMLFILGIALISGCINSSVVSNFNFQSSEGSCGINTSQTMSANVSRTHISFKGFVAIPNPCMKLEANYTVSNGNPDLILVKLTAKAIPGVDTCVQCVGIESFSGSFDINSKNFEVGIKYNDQTLGVYRS